jgi:hypothetical protein
MKRSHFPHRPLLPIVSLIVISLLSPAASRTSSSEATTVTSTGPFEASVVMLPLTCAGTKNWIAGDGFWQDPANWSGGTLPGPSDDVCIPAGVTVTLSFGTHSINSLGSNGTLVFSGGSLAIAGSLNSDGAITISGGGTLSVGASSSINNTLTLSATLMGNGDLDVSGLLTWNGGTMIGPGVTNANGGMSITGGSLNGRTLNNNGTTTFTGNNANVIGSGNGAIINNPAGSTFNLQGDVQYLWGCGLCGAVSSFNNAGTFKKTAGSGTAVFSGVIFNNTGTVEVQTGTLKVGAGTHTGSFTGSTGASLEFAQVFGGQTQDLTATSSVTVPNVQFSADTTNIAGTYNVSDSTTTLGVTVNFNSTIASLGSTLNANVGTTNINFNPATPPTTLNAPGGTANFNFTGAIGISIVNLTGGTINGPTTMNISGLFTWSGGTLMGPGTTDANGGMSITGGSINGRTLNNNGTATFTGNNANVIGSGNGAIINNPAGSTFNLQGDVQYLWGCGICGAVSSFNNAGTFKKTAGTGAAIFSGVTFNNTGTVEVQTGALKVGAGTHTGSFTGSAGTTIEFGQVFGGQTQTLAATSSITVPNVQFSADTTNIAGAYNVFDSTTTLGVTVNFNSPIANLGSILNTNVGTTNINFNPATPPTTLNAGGIANFNFTGTITIGTVNLTGTINGPTTMNISGLFTWNSGTLMGAGTTNANGGISINGGGSLNGRTLVNNGTANFSTGVIGSGNGAVISNPAGSTFILQGDVLYLWGCGICGAVSSFNNAGTFKKTAGSGSAIFGTIVFNNTGTVEAQSGTVAFLGGTSFTQTAGSTILNGGNISISTTLNIQGGSLSGAGTIAGNVSSGGSVRPGASPGIINITGNYTQTSTGALDIEIGGLAAGTQFDQLNISGTATLNGTLNIQLINGFVPNVGDAFQILSYASNVGTFATINGLIIGNAKKFQASYNPTNLTLDTVADSTEVPPPCVAVPSGLVSWWPGDGNANDIQGSNNGALMNGATFAGGRVNQGFSLDGNSFVSVPDSLSLKPQVLTIDAWIKTPGVGGALATFIASKSGSADGQGYEFGLHSSGRLRFTLNDAVGGADLLGSTIVGDNMFHHAAATYDGVTMRIYVDGQLDAEKTIATTIVYPDGPPFLIGGREYIFIPGHWYGIIDELEFFNRALSQSEIQAIFNAGSAGRCRTCTPPPTGMAAWWPGDGNTNDIQGSNNGALMNGATFAPGMVGQAFSLDGVDDFVQVPDTPTVSITGAISMDAWIKPNSMLGSAQTIISKYNTACPVLGTEQRSYILRVEPDGRLRFCLYPGDGNYRCVDTASPVISAGVFTHVAATFDPLTQSMKIYVNGLEVSAPLVGGSVNVITISDSDTPVTIGRNFCATTLDHFGGLIDEVELFNRELTSSEIQAIVNAGNAGKCKNRPPEAHCHNVTVSASSNCSANASIDNGSSDPDGDSITLAQSPQGPYALGDTSVTLTVTDGNGGSSTCTATVTVVDNTPPQITCPANVSVTAPFGQSLLVVTYPSPSAADNCPGVGAICSPPSGSTFPLGPTTVTCTATDASSNTANCSFMVTVSPPQLTALGSAKVWLGLKTSDDVGTRFDLLAELLKNGALVGSGQVDNVAGGSSGFNNAVARTINLALAAPVSVSPGDMLSIRLSVRIAVGVAGHRSGTARLWFNDAAADSNFGATIGGGAQSYYLISGSLLSQMPGLGPKNTSDVFVDRAVGGNPFKPFGTWSVTF